MVDTMDRGGIFCLRKLPSYPKRNTVFKHPLFRKGPVFLIQVVLVRSATVPGCGCCYGLPWGCLTALSLDKNAILSTVSLK